MPDLDFEVVGVEVPAFAAVPTLLFKLRVKNAIEHERVHSVVLRCQIRIDVTQRRYSSQAQARLLEIFGEPNRWGETLHAFLWTHANTAVPPFTGTIAVDLPVICTYDFEVASTKYFNALEDGEVPLTFLFSGTIFYENDTGNLQAGQVSWSKEATYRLPITLWQEMIAHHYPNSAWLRIQKDIFDCLYRYKATHGLLTWDEVVTHLLRANGEEVGL